jgi:imidazolonepropionase-like amidohydrolase
MGIVPSGSRAERRGLLGRGARLTAQLTGRAQAGLAALRERQRESGSAPTRGVAFTGTVWVGGEAEPRPGTVVVDGAGRIAAISYDDRPALPRELLVLGGEHHWVVPGIVDAHVHLGFDPRVADATDPSRVSASGSISGLDSGLVGVRDLGAPLRWAGHWQTGRRLPPPGSPAVAISGPILTAPGGYPSRSWGAGGYAEFVYSPTRARSVVQHLAAEGVDLIKVALERGDDDTPTLDATVLRAIVDAAHAAGLAVVAHALTGDLVSRALDAGVDELAHTPTERLDEQLIAKIAASGVSVTSTLQTFFSSGSGRVAAANAADLVAAGVILRYGTDLGNAGTRPGVDPRELDRLADTGLGRLGALRAATERSAAAAGMRSRTGMLRRGEPAAIVLLPFSPLAEPGVWRTPAAVYADGRLTVGQAGSSRRSHRESTNR